MIRPKPARWFEILAARDDAPRLFAALAATKAVELEPRSAEACAEPMAALLPTLRNFHELALRYGAYWPRPGPQGAPTRGSPLQVIERAIAQLRSWAAAAEPLVQRLQEIARERAELLLWQQILVGMDDSPVDFEQLGRPGPLVHKRLFVFPQRAPTRLPPGLVARAIGPNAPLHLLVVGTEDALQSLAQETAAVHGEMHVAPTWLRSTASASLAYVPSRLHALEREQAALEAAMFALEKRHELERVLGDAHRLQWLVDNVHALEATELFCWITGWTSDLAGDAIARAVDRSEARALLHFPAAPPHREPPALLRNPWWARPFEIFSRALGTPSTNEADPSVLLALVVPLMFGYMFGDVGQGLVIAIAGFALRRRFAVARLLIAGGLSAALFGLVFGSVFGTHSIAALWLHPLDAPLPVLIAPLCGGAVLLMLGLILDATEAHWHNHLGEWLASDAGISLAYLSLMLGPFSPRLLIGCAVGLALSAVGTAVQRRSVAAGVVAIAEFVERIVQLLINTLSFARVGAFALAHAGLSSAIVSLVDASDGWLLKTVVLVIGNLVVLALETMVVAIQTTRLVLFEFFTRFMTAQGRVFRPLMPAPGFTSLQESK